MTGRDAFAALAGRVHHDRQNGKSSYRKLERSVSELIHFRLIYFETEEKF